MRAAYALLLIATVPALASANTAPTEAPPISVWSPRSILESHRKPDARFPQEGTPDYEAWALPSDDPNYLALFVRVTRGKTIAAHVHSKAWHQTCVLAGTIYIWSEGTTRELKAGQCYTIPAGALHALRSGVHEDTWMEEITGPLGGYPPLEKTRSEEAVRRSGEINAALSAAAATK